MLGFGGRARREEMSDRVGDLAHCVRSLAGFTEEVASGMDRAEAAGVETLERLGRVEARLEELAAMTRHGLMLMETAPGVRAVEAEAGVALVRLKTGHPLYVPSADPGFSAQVMVSGQWQPGVGATLRRLVRPGHICVDLGAECGYFTVAMAAAAGASGRVLAFEPGAEAFELLRRSLWANGYSQDGRVRAWRGLAGVGDAPDLDRLLAEADPGGEAPVLVRLGDEADAVAIADAEWLSRRGEVALVTGLGDIARRTTFRDGPLAERLRDTGFRAEPSKDAAEDVLALIKPASTGNRDATVPLLETAGRLAAVRGG